MNVNLHIERLVLEGLGVESRDSALVKEVVQTELRRLFVEDQRALRSLASKAMPSVAGAAVSISAAGAAPQLGSAIAQSVYGAISR